jgi:hypothetical protein
VEAVAAAVVRQGAMEAQVGQAAVVIQGVPQVGQAAVEAQVGQAAVVRQGAAQAGQAAVVAGLGKVKGLVAAPLLLVEAAAEVRQAVRQAVEL